MDFTQTARILALSAASVLATRAPVPFPVAAQGTTRLDDTTAAALEALADPALEAQRAGAFETVPPLDADQLAALAAAERAAPGLEHQRGGDIHLTDREVQIVLWTAAVIAVVLIVA